MFLLVNSLHITGLITVIELFFFLIKKQIHFLSGFYSVVTTFIFWEKSVQKLTWYHSIKGYWGTVGEPFFNVILLFYSVFSLIDFSCFTDGFFELQWYYSSRFLTTKLFHLGNQSIGLPKRLWFVGDRGSWWYLPILRVANLTIAQLRQHNKEVAKRYKALLLLHSVISDSSFTQIINCKSPKEA